MIAAVQFADNGYSVLVNGREYVSGESFTIAERVRDEINSGEPDVSTECGDVADVILRSLVGRVRS